MGGEAMAIHASVEEADEIIDQIMGTVTIFILTFTLFFNQNMFKMKLSINFCFYLIF